MLCRASAARAPVARVTHRLAGFGNGSALDFVHLCLPGALPPPRCPAAAAGVCRAVRALLGNIARYRSPDRRLSRANRMRRAAPPTPATSPRWPMRTPAWSCPMRRRCCARLTALRAADGAYATRRAWPAGTTTAIRRGNASSAPSSARRCRRRLAHGCVRAPRPGGGFFANRRRADAGLALDCHDAVRIGAAGCDRLEGIRGPVPLLVNRSEDASGGFRGYPADASPIASTRSTRCWRWEAWHSAPYGSGQRPMFYDSVASC